MALKEALSCRTDSFLEYDLDFGGVVPGYHNNLKVFARSGHLDAAHGATLKNIVRDYGIKATSWITMIQ